ncbi:MAG TPA: xylulokinase [Actinomycetes bacterium]
MTVAVGVDVGTTGARGVAVDEAGEVVAGATSTYELRTPKPLWAEQDPADWWRAVQIVLGRLAGEVGEPIAGLGLTGQMHGSVFLDSAGAVIRPALLWNDQRTARQCSEISERVGAERLARITGNPALTGFQAPKVLWLREEEPEHYARVAHVLLPKDYVRLRLTGELATDASDAAGTLFLGLRERRWSSTILDALEVPAEWLPEVYESPEPTGVISAEVASAIGLPRGIPVAAGGGDNAAAAIGTAIVRDGVVSSSIGTSGVLFAHTDTASTDLTGRIHAFCHAVPSKYCLLGVTLSAGGSLRWWRDTIGVDYDTLIGEAESVGPGAEGLIFLPYLTGERTPHLDPEARGVFFGLTARHSRAHMTRALLEGVLFSLRDALETMRELGVRPSMVVATGGGSSSSLWRQLQADVYSTAVGQTVIQEGAAYGAALLGHVAAGTFASVEEAVRAVRMVEGVTEPDLRAAGVYDATFEIYRSLYARTEDLMHGLTALAAS